VPWPLEELRKELARPFSGLRVLRPADSTHIIGFLNYWRIADELQLMNIAVTPAERGRGHGRAMLADLLELARAHTASCVVLEVRPSNRVAIALYERCGFARVGLRPRYYSDNGEDALLMRAELRRA